MTRPPLERLAACLVSGLVGLGVLVVGPAGSTSAAAAEATPLTVTIDSLSPSTIPAKGRITVTGQVTNSSDSTWVGLNTYLLTSAAPFRTQEELEAANVTDPTMEIGQRLTEPGLFDPVGDLAPGSSTSYSLSVPRSALEVTGEPGVYWLGVHVLGASEDGRDAVADGRARSFIPLMARNGPDIRMSLVLPIKGGVRRGPDGSLANVEAWQAALGPEGRLNRLLQLTATAGDLPLTWVVDPAVLDAARSTARDNPGTSITPTDQPRDGDDQPSESPGPTEEPSDGEGADPDDEPEPELSEEAEQAAAWVQTFKRQAGRHTVMTVPYGDADVASMIRRDFEGLYKRATELSADTLEALDVDATPVVAPPSGYLPTGVLEQLDEEVPVLLSDLAAPGATGPVVETRQGHRIVLTDSSAGSGGPPPTSQFSALAVRQRILSGAAVHALSAEADEPLVVSMPQTWDPGSGWRSAQFFTGLEVPWLRAVGVPSVLSAAGVLQPEETAYDERLRYPRRERRVEAPLANLLATQELVGKGTVLAGLLSRNSTVDNELAKSGLLASSVTARQHPRAAANRVRQATAEVRNLLSRIEIDGPRFVTMSSESGPISVTVINGLEQPVVVGIDAASGDELTIPSPDPVALGPGQRATVRLSATAKSIGVHSVQLRPTTEDGLALGHSTTFRVRSSQVGLLIWVIMGIGAGILVITSAVRMTQRVRNRKSSHGPQLKGAAE